MKKIKLSLLWVLMCLFSLNSQSQEEILTTNLDITVYTSSFDEMKVKLADYLIQNPITVISQTESTDNFYAQIYLDKQTFEEAVKFISALGFVSNKELGTTNNSEEANSISIELDYLVNQKSIYEKELSNMTEKDNRYYTYWEHVRDLERQIFTLTKKKNAFAQKKVYYISVNLYNEVNDLTSNRVSWVNMPGVASEMMFIENPVASLSSERYLGYSLKYMFTRGKSYAILGALKEFGDEEANADRYTELFLFSVGQDFYTKHFGRGKNKFFNLYSGYNLGGAFATADDRKQTLAFVKILFGVELFKNKYILLDNYVSYFVPFYENRNFRGWTYNVSFNFVF